MAAIVAQNVDCQNADTALDTIQEIRGELPDLVGPLADYKNTQQLTIAKGVRRVFFDCDESDPRTRTPSPNTGSGSESSESSEPKRKVLRLSTPVSPSPGTGFVWVAIRPDY